MALQLRREDFIIQYPPINFLNVMETGNIWDKKEMNLYIHIPYCMMKCGFCYYLTFSIGNKSIPDEYIDSLKREIELYAEMPEIKERPVRSIYFGGGTPTLLSEKQLESLLLLIKDKFNLLKNVEICFEVRPGKESSIKKLRLLRSLGTNRISIGCQSTDDAVLVANGRNHKVADFYETFECARQADIYCINVDLMSGLVDQTFDSWLETIDVISGLRPENIAIYKFELYLNNLIYKKYRSGKINLISDEAESEYIKAGYKRLLDKGYIFADHFSFIFDRKFDHIHRREIWRGSDMLGIGLSSHSCLNGYLFQNESKIDNYYNIIQKGLLPIKRAHKISKKEEMTQRIVFGIKELNINRHKFEESFGIDLMQIYGEQFYSLEEEGLLNINPESINLTFNGAVFADDIGREFYLPEHKNMMLAHVSRAKSDLEN
jgi:putative oxygen-independent coproporphyrinogen III oxidase